MLKLLIVSYLYLVPPPPLGHKSYGVKNLRARLGSQGLRPRAGPSVRIRAFSWMMTKILRLRADPLRKLVGRRIHVSYIF